MRRTPALIGAAALLAGSLAGCTAAPIFGGCTPPYDSGDASSLVTADGKIGSDPSVDFPTPLYASEPEVTRLIAGDGAPIGNDGQVDYAVSYYVGGTGEKLGSTGYGEFDSEDPPARSAVGLDEYAISAAFTCMSVGDRFVLVAQAGSTFGPGQGGVDDDTELVLVVDVLDAFLGKADGFNHLPLDGMPVVVTAVDGTPAITITGLEKPEATRSSTIKGGDGATVRDGDAVHVHVRAWTWPAAAGGEPAEFASTWANRRQSFDVVLDDSASNPIPPGVRGAMTGVRVGSQLLVVIPPGDDSYPTPPQGVAPDATMIWVVDILGIRG